MARYSVLLLLLILSAIPSFSQPGKNGSYTVPAFNTVINRYSAITANVPAGATTITVNNIAGDLGGLAAGDLIMLYQAQGAIIQTTDDNDYGTILNYNNAGTYEYAYVASVAGNVITIGCGTKRSFNVAGRSQVVKVPQYQNLIIPSGTSIVAGKWNGTTGGILAVHVKGALTNNGIISAESAGFRGGKRDNLSSTAGAGIVTLYRSTLATDGGEKGEGIAGYQTDYEAAGMGGRYGRGAPANGGGGGNGHNAAGGGGANGNNGLPWTGAGVMDPNPLYLPAWGFDPDFIANGNSLTNSSGGGRGGYTYAANNADAFSTPLSDPAWGGDYRDPVGGRGGRPLNAEVESRIFFGGGGGAGDGNNNASNDGGDGGGIVYIISHTINGTGVITAQGQNGFNTTPSHNDAPGGGGGGGSIVVKAFNFTGQALKANGGAGGNQLITGNESEGCGGGGGGGFIAVPTGGTGSCGTTNSFTYIFGTNGTSSSASVTEFPANGGTWGASGQNDVPVSPYFMPYTLTCIIDGDGDGVHDAVDLDSDNDGIPDLLESYGGVDPGGDHDGDGAPNYADPSFVPYLDSNCDGINDYFDFDLDGIPDFLDLDSDNDGITDCVEAGGIDANGDGIVDNFTDADNNGLADSVGAGLIPPDMDGDGRRSFQDRDSDGDGITDCYEAGGLDANGDGIIDNFTDSDGDGLADSVDPTTDRRALTASNASGKTPLALPDTDGDGKRDFLDIDSDNDGITDNVEAQTIEDYIAPINIDANGNGICDLYDLNPLPIVNTDGADLPDYRDSDSDNDGVPDAIEGHDANSDGIPVPALPVAAGDSDGDGLLNAYDLVPGPNVTAVGLGGTGSSSPLQDTDGDGTPDWRDTDDDGDCILTVSTGVNGENGNGNASWSDDFSHGGSPIPDYLFPKNKLTVAGASLCGAGPVTLNASASESGTFRWYNVEVGGTPQFTTSGAASSNFVTPSLTATTTYYVEFQNALCITPRQAVIAMIVSGSSTPTTTGASRCDAGNLTLSAASGSVGTFRWYNAPVAGTLLQTTTGALTSSFTTPSIATTTTYYVEFDNGTCTTSRAAVVASIGTPPVVNVTGGATCGSTTVTLSASAPGTGTFRWYDAATGGTLVHIQTGVGSSTFTTPSITSSTTYYVEFGSGSCVTGRTPVSANVTAPVSAPSVTPATICSTGTVTLTATHTSSGTFRWYDAATGGNLLFTTNSATSSSYTTPSISSSTDYFVEFTNATCTSPRVRVTATVILGSITVTGASRCGTGSVSLSAVSPIAGTFTWYTASTGGTAVYTTTNATASSYTTPSINTTRDYYVQFTSASLVCTTPSRIAVPATISTAVTLTATGGGLCSPGSVALSAASGTTTGTFRWYANSTGGTALHTTTGATTSTFNTPLISETTDYYVEFDNGTCVTNPRTVVRAAVVNSTGLSTTDGSRCGTGSVELLVNSLTQGTFNWYAAETGGSALATSGANASSHSYSPNVTTTTTFYVSLTTASPSCTSTRFPVVATVYPAAAAPSAIGGSRCGTGSVVLAASSSTAGTIRWYTASSGGTALQTDNTTTLSTYVTPSITATRTYYAEFSNGGCTSGRVAVVATVNSGTAPTAPSTTSASLCGSGSASLTATSTTSGNFRWWSAATGGTLLQTSLATTSSTFTTPSLTATTTYYVEFDNGVCVSTRSAVTVTVNAVPGAPTASDAERCGAGSVSLTATASSAGTFEWYDAPTGGTQVYTSSGSASSVFSTSSLSTTTSYYVQYRNATCNSSRTRVDAVIRTLPTAPSGVDGNRCGTGTVLIGATSTSAGTFRWYDATTGGNLLGTSASTSASSFTTPSISSTTTFYVEFDNGSCTSSRSAVAATILSVPATPTVVEASRCGSGTVDLSASSSSNGTFRWYANATGGASLKTDAATSSSSFTTSSLSSTTTYYVEFDNGSCLSARAPVVATVNPKPVIVSSTPGCTGIAGNGTIEVVANISSGSLEYSVNGTAWQSSSDFTALANGTYTVYVRESSTECVASLADVVVKCNVPPTVSDKALSVLEDEELTGDVTDPSDVDPDGTTITASVVTGPTNGSLDLSADGSFTYTPDENFFGTETIVFKVCDSGSPLPAACVEATLTITVTSVNDAPVAVADNGITTDEDTEVTFNVTTNDTDVDGTINVATVDLDPSTAGIQSSITNTYGTWEVSSTGVVTYTPKLNFNGTATASYTVNDNSGATSNTATITVTVIPVNDAPVAVADSGITTDEDTEVTFNVTTNDTDVDGTINAATVDLDPSTTGIQSSITNTYGTWAVSTTGVVTYTPATDFNGTATASYTVNDNSGATSNTATITITVTSVNDAPVAVADSGITTDEDTEVTFNVTTNDTDVDGTINAATVDLDPSTTGIQSSITNTYGTWEVSTTGVVTYTPKLNFNGTATASYTVNDNSGATSNTATITVTVTPVNDAPVAVADSGITTDEDTEVTFNVTTNDTDVDGTINAATVDLDPSTAGIQSSITNTYGTWAVSSTGVVTYTPATDFNGTATASYTVNDNSGATSNTATITVTVTPVNDAPVAVADNGITTDEDIEVTFNVTTNDTDVDGTINVATVDLDPSTTGIQSSITNTYGTWAVSTTGVVTYTPATDFNGTATASYTVNDNSGATSNTATITVTVTPVNDAPVAVADSGITTDEDTEVTFNVTTNDTDVDGTINVATVDLDPSTTGIQSSITNTYGTWEVSTTGVVTYTPATDFNGTATASYTVNDNSGATSNTATITVTVTPVNDAPVAVADSGITTDEDTEVTFNVTTNDTDVDGTINAATVDLDPLTTGIQSSITNTYGTWEVSTTGVVTYTPKLNFNGTATASYTVNDNSGATSNTATITITVTSVNDAPVAVADSGITTDEDTEVTFNVTMNDTDVDGTINAATVDLDPSTTGIQSSITNTYGTWEVSTTGVVTYTPATDFNGTATASYTVNDNSGATSNIATITVTVTPVNDAPVAVADNGITTDEDTEVTFNVTTNDTDVDGTINVATVDLDPSTAGIQSSITNTYGTWEVSSTGVVTYTPKLNFNGTATASYTVNDNSGATSNTATITVTVTPVNDAPVAVTDSGITTDEDTEVTFNVTTNDTDVDGTINAATVDLDPSTTGIQSSITNTYGTWEVSTTGVVTYTPKLNFNGTATASYTVNDNSGATSNTATITVTVTPVNDAPVAVADFAETDEDTPVTFNVVQNDTDVDGTPQASSVDLDPSTSGIQKTYSTTAGSWSVDVNGNVTYTPTLNFNGTASISYVVTDDGGAVSEPGTLTITVNDINDIPVATNDTYTGTEDIPLTFTPLENDTDVDGTLLPGSIDLNPSTPEIESVYKIAQGVFTADAAGNVTFTPLENFNGTVTLTYRNQDDDGAFSASATVTLTILPVNDAPVLVDNVITVTQSRPANGTLLTADDYDPDGTPLTVNTTPVTPPQHGTIVINTNGTFIYTPTTGYIGSDEIVIQVCDNGLPLPAACATTKLVISIVENQAPLVSSKIISLMEDATYSGSILSGTDHDPEGLFLAVSTTPAEGPAHGTITINSSGSYTYTPQADYSGSDLVKIRVCDTNPVPACSIMELIITVNGENDAPIIENEFLETTINTAVSGNILQNDHDVEGTELIVEITPVAGPLHGSITMDAAGNFVFTPDRNFIGVDEITFTICDSGSPLPAKCVTDTITITVSDPYAGEVSIPEGFSPNGDGDNDEFVIGYNGSERIQLEVYNRWGNLVYKSDNYQNDWRGTAMYGLVFGSEVPDGTYFYKVKVGRFEKVKSFTIQR